MIIIKKMEIPNYDVDNKNKKIQTTLFIYAK